GKVDRARLPVPAMATEAVGPTETLANPIEEVVAGIWARCLGLEAVGLDDDFFALGGHSLLAAELLGQINAASGVDLAVPVLFEAPTPRKLAAEAEAAISSPEVDRPLPLHPAVRAGAIPLTRGQARLWAASRLQSNSGSYNLSGVVSLPNRCVPEVLTRAFNEVVNRHEALRTRILEVDGRPRQVVEAAVWVDVPVDDLTALEGAQAERRAGERIDDLATTRFALDSAPLVSARLLRLPDGDRLAVVTHHIVADGWSLRVLFRELLTVHDAFSQGRASPLPGLSAQFADWVVWQRESHRHREPQLAFWRDRLRGLPESVELSNRPRPPVPRNRGRSLSFAVDADTTSGLRDVCRRESCTLFMALLAAYATLLHRRTGATDVAVGTDMANRVPPGSEALVGMFINQIVLRLDLDGEPDFRELLRRARRATGEAHAHQSVPFEELVDELLPSRDPSLPPLVQVKLVLENTDSGLHASSEDDGPEPSRSEARDDTPAQLDLTLYVYDLGRRLRGLLVYDVDLFDDEDAESLAREFHEILRELVADPAAQAAQEAFAR
ncbi:MAG: condensation domain-containing protein, partial [Actinomycetota bacterium]|nr:condensation domain-containing protein [Actinomycetota bacterium]